MRMDNNEGVRRWRFGLAEASLALVALAAGDGLGSIVRQELEQDPRRPLVGVDRGR
jgi:hypothetical protein